MRVLGFLLQKEFIQIMRDKAILLILFLITVILLFILPRSAKVEVSKVALCVVDYDHSTISSGFVRKLTGSDLFVIGARANSYEEGVAVMERNEVAGILEIPKGFEKKLLEGMKSPVMLEIDAVHGTTAGLSSFYFLRLLQEYLEEYVKGMGIQPGGRLDSQEELMKRMMEGGQNRGKMVEVVLQEKVADPAFLQVKMSVNNRYNPDGKSKLYQIPSILAILVCLVGMVLAALNIVTERENGTIEQMNVSPVKRSAFILSKVIPFWVIGMAILSIGLLVVWLLYGVVPRGSYGSIYLVSFLFLVVMVGMGILVSTACRNQQQAMLLCFFFLLIICLLCGLWTPIASMPAWAKVIAGINPLRYYVEAMRLIFAYGSGVRHVLPHIVTLCVFIVVFNGWAIWNFRKAG